MPGFVGAQPSGRYKADHQRARAAAFALLPEWTTCVRGQHTMWKWAKDKQGRSALHYDHNDTNTGYIGFSCALHNRRDGASKGARAQHNNKHRHPRHRGTYTPPRWGDPGPGW